MSSVPILRLGALRDVEHFQQHLRSLGVEIPCDSQLISSP